jgi:uncharacterized protein involved in exopolysaccharide biosynthesis
MDRTTGQGSQAAREPRRRGLEGSEIVYVLCKRKRLIAAAVLAAVGLAVLPGLVTPPLWEASTTLLLVRRGGPDGGAAAPAVLPEPQFLARPAVLAGLVERLGPAAVLRARLDATSSAPPATPASLTMARAETEQGSSLLARGRALSAEEDRAVRSLAGRLEVTPLPNAGAVRIAVRAPEARFATAVLAHVVTDYLAQDRAADGPDAAVAFLGRERARLETELTQAESWLQRLDGAQGGQTAVQRRDAYLQSAHERETALHATRSEIEELKEKRRVLSTQLERLPEKVMRTQEVRANPVLERMRAKVLELELQRNNLVQRYQSHERRVRDADAEIALLRQRFLAESDWEFARETYGQNPVRDPLLVELFNTEAHLIRSEVKARHLERTVQDFTARLQQADRVAYERARAERRVALLGEAQALYARQHEEARIAAVRETRRRVDVAQVEPIHVGAPAARPAALTELSIGGGLVGLLAGAVLALVVEALGGTFTTPDSVGRRLGLPVLGVLPAERPK